MADGSSVLVIGELSDDQPSLATNEGLGIARGLAESTGGSVAVAFLSTSVPASATSAAIASGADKVYAVEDPLLGQVNFELWVAALERLCKQESPGILLMGKSSVGRDLAPRLAFRLGTGLLSDCLELWVDKDSKYLVGNRPVYGGSAVATITHKGDLPMASFRLKTHDPLSTDSSRTGEVVNFSPGLNSDESKVTLGEQVRQPVAGVRLEDASVIIGGGRGLGGPEPFQQLEELASLLGGAVGASRAVCDAGWLPSSYQIGLTGKTVTPDLYITIAISGASQHMAGCSASKTIVAINKDPECNIFRESRYGVVGTWEKVLPAFIEQVKELVKN